MNRKERIVWKLEKMLGERDDAWLEAEMRRATAEAAAAMLALENSGTMRHFQARPYTAARAREQMEAAGVDEATIAAVLADPAGYRKRHQ